MPNLQDLALTVYHRYVHTLMNTSTLKIIERDLGLNSRLLLAPHFYSVVYLLIKITLLLRQCCFKDLANASVLGLIKKNT